MGILRNSKIIFGPWKHKKTGLKSSILMAVCSRRICSLICGKGRSDSKIEKQLRKNWWRILLYEVERRGNNVGKTDDVIYGWPLTSVSSARLPHYHSLRVTNWAAKINKKKIIIIHKYIHTVALSRIRNIDKCQISLKLTKFLQTSLDCLLCIFWFKFWQNKALRD